MNKVSYLSAFIQEKYDLSQKDADNFVSQMFETLNEVLHTEKSVKIKGLGTFKVMAVNSRESVNVNTGKRFIIEARNKVSFTPETSMRDRVNTPFSQFETFVLNDGVDFSEIDERYASSDKDKMKESDEESSVTDVIKEEISPASLLEESRDAFGGTKIMAQENPKAETTETAASLNMAQLNVLNSEISDCTQPSASLDKEKNTKNVENVPEKAVSSIVATSQNDLKNQQTLSMNKADIMIDGISYMEDHEMLQEELYRSNRLAKILGGVIFVLFTIGCIGAYYMRNKLFQKDNRIEHLEAMVARQTATSSKKKLVTVTKPVKKVEETTKEISTYDQEHPRVKSTGTTFASSKPDGLKNETAKNNQQISKKLPKLPDYNKDPRVKTGAYRIVGIAKEVKVGKGQTLYSISNANLGAGMECYVEAVNDGKKDVKVGEILKIPALQLKKKRK